MPPRQSGRKGKGAAAAPPQDDRDHIGALPDDALRHVLSFLPAQEAVRTWVLARRWRHLWKASTGLRIACSNGAEAASVKELREFVYHLLLLRGDSPLDTCELEFGDMDEEDVPRVNLWLRHVVMRNVRVLELSSYIWVDGCQAWFQLDDVPLVSQHLTTLKFCGVRFRSSLLDFSSCPALENLEFDYCVFSEAKKISSESLKHMSITDSTFDRGSRIRICTPNLVSPDLCDFWHRTPLLESMPLLVKAFVRLNWACGDECPRAYCNDSNCESCDISDNIGDRIGTNNCCVLLQGLSKAKVLALTSGPRKFILKRDLKWCPTFSKLKTLLLNGYWCTPDDFRPLVCILEHAPVLEKLILQLSSEMPEHEVEIKGSVSPMEGSAAILKHLRIVEIKCEGVNEKILNVLIFLSAFNIRKPTCYTLLHF
ncbi:unnamed protein product [Urochloa decumbens]|uniref:F-box domain-containing protein n=1 Tax=Urochloa decumbens TaxID=240449 RepID=A0ABC9B590_9POAL